MVLVALVLALALTMSVCSALADGYTITIGNAAEGETYTAYKIFDATINGNAVSYTISSSNNPVWTALTTADSSHGYTVSTNSETNVVTTTYFVFTPTPTKTSTTYLVQAAESKLTESVADGKDGTKDVVKLAKFLDAKKSAFTSAGSTTGAASGTATTISVNDAGYYFVDTTLGSICSLDTVKSVTINEKNSIPTQDKTVSDTADGNFGDETQVKIGDPVYFKIVVTDGVGTDAKITVHDKMETGLTLDISSFAITDDDSNASEPAYSIKYNHDKPVKGTAGTRFCSH